jgi:hypothetical protein
VLGSIPTAPTNHLIQFTGFVETARQQKAALRSGRSRPTLNDRAARVASRPLAPVRQIRSKFDGLQCKCACLNCSEQARQNARGVRRFKSGLRNQGFYILSESSVHVVATRIEVYDFVSQKAFLAVDLSPLPKDYCDFDISPLISPDGPKLAVLTAC